MKSLVGRTTIEERTPVCERAHLARLTVEWIEYDGSINAAR